MVRKFKISLVLIFWLSLSGFAQLQFAGYKANFSKDTLFIGDTVRLSLEIKHDNNQIPVFPEFNDTIMKGLDIFTEAQTDTFTTKEGIKIARKLINIISFDPGRYIIQGFPGLLVNQTGLADTIVSNPLSITVLPMPVDTTAIDTIFAGIDGKIMFGLDFVNNIKSNFIPDSIKNSITEEELNSIVNELFQSKKSEIFNELAKQLALADTTGYGKLFMELVMAPANRLFIIKSHLQFERHALPQLIKENFIGQKKEVRSGDPLFSYYLIYDIKPPFDEKWSFWDELKYFFKDYGLYLIIALLIIALTIAYFLYFRKKKTEENAPEIPLEPAHIIAYRDLNKLKESKLLQAGKIKEFHSVLTEILRRYIEHRFGIKALEQTTFEILSDIAKNQVLNKTENKVLSEILELADLVKFAKLTPNPDENDRSLRNAFGFVDATKIKEQQADTKALNDNLENIIIDDEKSDVEPVNKEDK